MTFEELEEALQEILGTGYQIDKDNHGQIIIYTGLCEDDDGGDLVEFESDDEEDPDFDPEFEPLADEDDDD